MLDGGKADVQSVLELVKSDVTNKLDIMSLVELNRGQLAQKIAEIAANCKASNYRKLNPLEQRKLVTDILNDLLGDAPVSSAPIVPIGNSGANKRHGAPAEP
ncbi:MAG: hypothetical protein ACTSWM_05150, partial [Alphaproteobacteria bacterium]